MYVYVVVDKTKGGQMTNELLCSLVNQLKTKLLTVAIATAELKFSVSKI